MPHATRDRRLVQQPGYWSTPEAVRWAKYFETHRQLLVDALGCSVCGGAPIDEVDWTAREGWFQPNRRGGWVDPAVAR